MRKNLTLMVLFCLFLLLQTACVKETTGSPESGDAVSTTRAYGDKTPKIMVYVETNDTNPLNAGDYYLSDGKPLIDIVEFFASNIHKRTVNRVVEPTLYLNRELAPLLEPDPANPESTGYHQYVKPLQDKGIKVLMTVLGDWQDMGVANMNSTQTSQFARILAHAVEKYNLDGVGFSDSYANYSFTNSTSYSEILLKLRALMPAEKLITVFDWGFTNTINSEARTCIDYSYHGSWSAVYFSMTPGIGLDASRWAPIGLNLGNNQAAYYNTLRANSMRAKNGGYGVICNFNLRSKSDRDPMRVFEAYTAGAYTGQTVSCDGGDRPQDWTFSRTGYEINMDEVQ